MHRTARTATITVVAVVLVFLVFFGVLWLRSPMRGIGFRSWGHGPIGFGMMREIRQMQEWLERWYPNREPDVDYDPMMRDLSDVSDRRLDRVFLEDMIPHHMAAVMMSRQLLVADIAEHEQVEDLARSIRDSQLAEIDQMTEWLRRWYG